MSKIHIHAIEDATAKAEESSNRVGRRFEELLLAGRDVSQAISNYETCQCATCLSSITTKTLQLLSTCHGLKGELDLLNGLLCNHNDQLLQSQIDKLQKALTAIQTRLN